MIKISEMIKVSEIIIKKKVLKNVYWINILMPEFETDNYWNYLV